MNEPEPDETSGGAESKKAPGPDREAPAGAAPAPEPAPVPEAAPAQRPTGRAALRAALWPRRVTRAQLIVAVLLCALGFALAVQVQAHEDDGALRAARPEDLLRILSDLDENTSRLEQERSELERRLSELNSQSDQAEEAARLAGERERQLGVLAGTHAAGGPGIELTISDPGRAVGADLLLDTVQELRAAGAEALQINDVRVVADTAFVDELDGGGNATGVVLIDGRERTQPFVIKAIGSPQDLEPALNIPGGVVPSLENENATVTIDRPDEVIVDALRSAERPDYAQSSS